MVNSSVQNWDELYFDLYNLGVDSEPLHFTRHILKRKKG